MDQRKLMDNANTITDMAKVSPCTHFEWTSVFSTVVCLYFTVTLLFFILLLSASQTQNNVYEIVSDMNQKQELLDERVSALEERLNQIQEQLEQLPDVINRGLQAVLSTHKIVATEATSSHPSHTHLHPNDASTRPISYLNSSGSGPVHKNFLTPQPGSLDTA